MLSLFIYVDSEKQSLSLLPCWQFHLQVFLLLLEKLYLIYCLLLPFILFFFKRLLIAKTAFLVCVFALLFLGKVVEISYSKFESKMAEERNVEGARANLSSLLLLSLSLLEFFGILFAVSSSLNLLDF